MNKQPPELPNIEDATLRACLAPLMDAMTAGGELASQALAPVPIARPAPRPGVPAGSNDNPLPVTVGIGTRDRESPCTPDTLAEWRSQADDEFAAFRMIEQFLAMTDAELAAAAAEFPKQVAGTVARIARIKQRMAARYDRITAVIALLDRARVQASADAASD